MKTLWVASRVETLRQRTGCFAEVTSFTTETERSNFGWKVGEVLGRFFARCFFLGGLERCTWYKVFFWNFHDFFFFGFYHGVNRSLLNSPPLGDHMFWNLDSRHCSQANPSIGKGWPPATTEDLYMMKKGFVLPTNLDLGGGFKYFLFSPLLGEMIQFDLTIFFKWVETATT